MENGQNRILWIVIALCALVVAFKLGSDAESSRLHRRECTLVGGFPQGVLSQECYFDGEYDAVIRERLDRSCPTGKGWYIYNDSRTYWRHKCG